MLDAWTRGWKDSVFDPAGRVCARLAPAAAYTWAGLAAGAAAAAAAASGRFILAFGLWILNRILDGLDGIVARVSGTQGDAGAYLDILCDFAVYAAIPIALAFRLGGAAVPVTLALLAVFYVNAATWMYLSALLEKRGAGSRASGEPTSITMPRGLVGGTETVLFYSAFLLFPRFYAHLAGAMAGLTLLGALLRARAGMCLLAAPGRDAQGGGNAD